MEVMQKLSQGSENRSAIARIRDIFDDIEIALSAGVKREAIWEALQNEGYKMPLKTFESAIYRIRKEWSEQRKHKDETGSEGNMVSQPPPSGGNEESAGNGKNTKIISNRRPRLLSEDKGLYGGLNPSPVDGIVELKQK
ncbi:MAG: hypothetical protein ACYCTY_13855 [Sulfuricella sp.]